VTLLPELALGTEIARSGLRVRPFTRPAPQRTLALVWRRSSPLAAPLREIAATLRRACPRRSARARGQTPAPSAAAR